MRRLASAILIGIAVSGCASAYDSGYGRDRDRDRERRDHRGNPPITVGPDSSTPDPLARSATYSCEDLTTVVLTEGQRTAQATLNSGTVLNLARQPDLGGFRFGVPPYEFRGRGSEATFLSNNRVWRCRMR